jgi:hypothetical protein
VTVTGQGQQLGVEIIEEAEVEGTICDCGEILLPAEVFQSGRSCFLRQYRLSL